MFKKRVLPILLSLALIASSALSVAYAVDASQEPETTPTADELVTAEGVELNKTAEPNGKGGYTITMEAYTTGEVKTEVRDVPLDIVMVLDVSGSMDEYLTVGSKNDLSQLNTEYGGAEGVYRYGWGALSVPMRYKNGKWQYWAVLGWLDIDYSFAFTDVNISKINALKISSKVFLDQVAEKSEATGVDHNVSIVKFAGNKRDTIGNDTYYDVGTCNYSQIVTDFTDPNSAKGFIDQLESGGATSSDYGMQHAQALINQIDPNRDSNKVVIMFTDGEPTHWNTYEQKVANDTISASKELKEKGTTVYTIGVFEGADDTVPMPSNVGNVNKYMHYVSSNFKNAESLGNGGVPTYPTDSSYYLAASSASELDEVFQEISEGISTPDIHLDASTIIKDVITPQFTVPTDSEVRCWTQDATGQKDGENYIFENDTNPINATVTVDSATRTVNITGFNFDENFVTTDDKDASEPGVDHGRKLVIQFDVKPVNGFFGGNGVLTNGSESGIYSGDGKLVENFVNPTVDVPIQYDFGTQNDEIWLGQAADLSKLLLPEPEGYFIDGVNNAFVNLTFKMLDPAGELVGTRTIKAGEPLDDTLNDWVWEDNASDGYPALDETTKYTITCDVTASVEDPDGVENIHLVDNATVTVIGGSLTIKKTGGAPGERYVFNIYQGEVTGDPYMTVAVTNGGSTKITGLAAGTYTVVEDTKWSWRYENKTQEAEINATTPERTVAFENKQDNDNWLNKYEWVINDQVSGKVEASEVEGSEA